MGVCLPNKSNQVRDDHHHCEIYQKYGHCCKRDCFSIDSVSTRESLVNALKQYNAEYIMDEILQYLPFAFEIVKHNDTSYLHAPISDMYGRGIPPCSVWLKHIITKQYGHYKQEHVLEIKCVIYGDDNVGKTTLIIRAVCSNFYLDSYDPTIEDYYRKQISVHGQTVMVDVLDTAGEHQYSALQSEWILRANVFMLFFAINNRNTFENIESYRNRILKARADSDNDCGMMLVATKCDLEHERQVSREEAIETANEWNVPYVETSARDKINVDFLLELSIYIYWISSCDQCTQ
eukprot:137614_1